MEQVLYPNANHSTSVSYITVSYEDPSLLLDSAGKLQSCTAQLLRNFDVCHGHAIFAVERNFCATNATFVRFERSCMPTSAYLRGHGAIPPWPAVTNENCVQLTRQLLVQFSKNCAIFPFFSTFQGVYPMDNIWAVWLPGNNTSSYLNSRFRMCFFLNYGQFVCLGGWLSHFLCVYSRHCCKFASCMVGLL